MRDPVSVSSELMTEEEEEEEEKGLIFLEKIGGSLIQYVKRFREIKKEHKQHTDHEELGNEL